MAPRNEPRYTFPFLLKITANEPQKCPYGKRYPFTGFCVSHKNFIKIPLNKKALSPLYTPQKGTPMKGNAHFLAQLNIPFGFLSKGALPQGPFIKSLTEKCPIARALLHSSFEVPSI